ncbi:cation diffusion facilitator family transporter [Chloroflexota bacterium]
MEKANGIFSSKTGVAVLSVLSNSFLIAIKLVAGIVTGSIGIIAEAIHSAIDLVASVIALVSVRVSGRPADSEHPFGHGKAESISGLVEASLIFVAAALIIREAILRIAESSTLKMTEVGIAVMLVSVLVNVVVSRRLLKVARATDSLALEADAAHLTTDVYTSLGVLVGLVVVRFTGLVVLDAVVAIGVAGLVVKAAYDITKKSVAGLMDVKLPIEDEALIRQCIEEHGCEVVGFHHLRTRKVGSQRHIDLHLVMAEDASLQYAHDMCDHLEEDIRSRLRNASITIHVEPCTGARCEECAVICSLRH